MNLNALYELRTRLASGVIAGTGVIEEDFRLKRAVEQVEPLASLSPVFKKIYMMAQSIFDGEAADRGGRVLDTLALTDAVLCTQAAIGVDEEIKSLNLPEGNGRCNAPYSILAPVLEALNGTGGGRYAVLTDAYRQDPALFHDYRLKDSLIKGLGDSYNELADEIEGWLSKEDRTIIPLLKAGFDPKGKKDMVRRIRVMEAIAGADENAYYCSLLETAEKDVRAAVIAALRHDKENAGLLLTLAKTEKGNCKKAVQSALAFMDTDEVNDYWKKQLGKKPENIVKFLCFSDEDMISDMLAEALDEIIDRLTAQAEGGNKNITDGDYDALSSLLRGLTGKSSGKICEFYRKAAAVGHRFDQLKRETEKAAIFSVRAYYSYKTNGLPFSECLPLILCDALIFKPEKSLLWLAQELYQAYGTAYLAPYFVASLLECKKEEVYEKFSPYLVKEGILHRENAEQTKIRKDMMDIFGMAEWNENKKKYGVCQYYYDEVKERNFSRIQWLDDGLDDRWFDLLTDSHLKKNGRFYHVKYTGGFSVEADHDQILMDLINPGNNACCKQLGSYFYHQACTVKDNRRYYKPLALCKWENCRGLLTGYLKKKGSVEFWYLKAWLSELPMSSEEKARELEDINRMVMRRELSARGWNEEQIADWCTVLRAGKEMEE